MKLLVVVITILFVGAAIAQADVEVAVHPEGDGAAVVLGQALHEAPDLSARLDPRLRGQAHAAWLQVPKSQRDQRLRLRHRVYCLP